MELLKKIKNYTYNERHCLGEGSFGKVYEAISDEGKKVAIKKVEQKLISSDSYLRSSLENEINIMKKLKHPNIVELYDVVLTANSIYLVMEHCSGGDLKRYCRNKKITQDVALYIIKQIVRGFEEIHKFGIIHRDLKPANILVHQETFKICDFGFAKFFGDNAKMAKTCVGTPIYMSPQVLKQKHYTQKTDIWSLGVLFYELVFNKLPYTGYSEEELYKNILKGALNIPTCTNQSKTLINNCLIVQQFSRWSWKDIFSFLFQKNTPVQKNNLVEKNNAVLHKKDSHSEPSILGLFYKKQNQPSAMEEKRFVHENSYDNLKMNQYNNYLIEAPPIEQPILVKRAETHKPKPRNMLAVHSQDLENISNHNLIKQVSPPELQIQQPLENARFLYFILIEFLANPIENSITMDMFLYNLWRYTIQQYERTISYESSKSQKNGISCYQIVLASQFNQIRALERQMKVRKDGDVRKLAEIVFKEAIAFPNNRSKLIWLKRFLDERYINQTVQ